MIKARGYAPVDRLSRIAYEDILKDRQSSNISEYLLRDSAAVRGLLMISSDDKKAISGECSDFDLLRAFLECIRKTEAYGSLSAKYFEKTASGLLGRKDVLSMSAEDIWEESLKRLSSEEMSLDAMISGSGLEKIGIAVTLNESRTVKKSFFCGSTEVTPVVCPFGAENISYETIEKGKIFANLNDILIEPMSDIPEYAVFVNGFIFEKPNEYGAAKAYERLSEGRSLSERDNGLLMTQLMRSIALSLSNVGGELMLFLPSAGGLDHMADTLKLIRYLDDNVLTKALKLSIFSCDAVSACAAASMSGHRYKNITAVTGISGNGSGLPDALASEYWGVGHLPLEIWASLSKNAGYLYALDVSPDFSDK